jgi:hypothetical protein
MAHDPKALQAICARADSGDLDRHRALGNLTALSASLPSAAKAR